MLAAILILSLLSLLVATEADPSGTPADSSPGEPLRPADRHDGAQPPVCPDRLAA